MNEIWQYLRKLGNWPGLRSRVSGVIFLSMLTALFEGLGIGVLIPLLETIQNGAPGDSTKLVYRVLEMLHIPLGFVPMLLVGLFLFSCKALLNYARVIWMTKTTSRFQVDLQSKTYNQLLNFDISFINNSRSGELVGTLVMESQRAVYSLELMMEMLAGLGLVVVYGLVQLKLSWTLTAGTFMVLAPLAYLLRPRQTYQWGVEQTTALGNIHSMTQETLSGIREVKALELEKLAVSRFTEVAQRVVNMTIQINRGNARFILVFQLAVVTALLGITYVGTTWSGLSLPHLLVFLLTLQRMTPQVQSIVDKRHRWLGSLSAFEKVERLIERTHVSQSVIVEGVTPFSQLTHDIKFSAVGFQHVGRERSILADVSLKISKGQMLALVGPSGAGKSTVLDLLARFYDPSRGRIEVNDCDLREYSLSSWRRSMGLVSQDTFLFNDTVENNIRYGRWDATKEEIKDATRQAYLDVFISNLPEGYQTMVGDRGIALSGGQRQRIALARAILRRPKILLLDEATSDLDSESEAFIQRAIQDLNRHCTVVVVAHRLSTVEKADHIVVLDEGRVLETGTHIELLSRGGRYAELYKLQFPGAPKR